MWRPEPPVEGPRRPRPRDLPSLNRVFAEAFTDRYRRDGLPGVRVPHLNPEVWNFAIADAGDGAMVWLDPDGQVAAFNLAHCSGTEGWMGPLAVRPGLQGGGLGTTVVRTAVDWLESQGARTIGLETMPRTMDNIGFYARLGFLPGALTITLVHDAIADPSLDVRLAALGPVEAAIARCHALLDTHAPGRDYRREIRLTLEARLGDVTVVREGGDLVAWALWHKVPLAESRAGDEVRVLKVVARDLDALERLGRAVAATAATEGRQRVGVRCQTADPAGFARLQGGGWRTLWTDLRMTLAGRGEVPPARGVVWSNWEI